MEFLAHNYYWILLALASGGMLVWPLVRGNGRNGVSTAQAVQLINRNNAVILDIRSKDEFAAGHLVNARHIEAKDLAERSKELAKFKKNPIIVVCHTGARSAPSVKTLQAAGFEQAVNLDGGIAGWQKAGQMLVKEA